MKHSNKSDLENHQESESAEDDFFIIDDDEIHNNKTDFEKLPSWNILIVDDDQNIHNSTDFALRNIKILNQPVKTIHCLSGTEAFKLLSSKEDIAVILLDVVMESPDAGLLLVKRLRKEGFSELRIILNTGQPGYAPELTVMSDYDINDYVVKSELSQTKLVSLLTAAIRSYSQLHAINHSRNGLELIIDSMIDIYKRRNLQLFATGILMQLISFFNLNRASGLVAATTTEPNPEAYTVLAGSGQLQSKVGVTVADLKDNKMLSTFQKAQNDNLSMTIAPCIGLHFSVKPGHMLFVYIDTQMEISDYDLSLLKVFAGNILVGFENIALIAQLDRLAYEDSIIPLPNRNAFEVTFRKFMEEGRKMTHIRVHLNHLGQFISAFGTHIVDKALLLIAKNVKDKLSTHIYFLGYAGNGEFLLLVDPHFNVNKTIALFESQVQVDNVGLSIPATFSLVKVSTFLTPSAVLQRGISAMVMAQETPNIKILQYDDYMSNLAVEHLNLQASLRDALMNQHEIQACLQPKVDCVSRRIIGAEALCRWNHKGRIISPCIFIPIAETGGLSTMVSDRMLTLVSAYCRSRRERKLPEIRIAVNLSMHEVQTPDFASMLNEKVESLGLTPESLEFEVTESVMMNDPKSSVRELKKIKDKGYHISIDDFGTGYSSLSYIEQLPLNILKIDRAFVRNLTLNTARNSLAAIAISLAEKMELETVAEGVETEEQHNALISLGCNTGQGYFYGKPMSMEEFDSFLAAAV